MSSLPKAAQPKRFRSSGGRTRSMTGLRIFGLLGLLVTLALMGLLGAKVISSMNDAEPITSASTAPGAPTTAAGASPASPAPAADAAATACAVNIRTVRTAVQAFVTVQGRPPTSMEDLVASGLLDAPVPDVTVTPGGDTATVAGAGPCA